MPSALIYIVPDEVIADIFILCLPSHSLVPISLFPSPIFRRPSPAEAPLLFCQVSTHWRAIATGLGRLWESLDTQSVRHPELVDLWLRRARRSALTIRIAQPIIPRYESVVLTNPPKVLPSRYYQHPMHLHLPILLPKIPQFRCLELVDFFIPHFLAPQSSSPLALESLSAAIDLSNTTAAHWIADLLSQAPRLTKLQWQGPAVGAPWAQLSHLRLQLDGIEPRAFEQILDSLSSLTEFRICLGDKLLHVFGSPTAAPRTLPNVVTLSIAGDSAATRFFMVPNLKHLVIESALFPACDNVIHLLLRSDCTLISLEIWEGRFKDRAPTLLKCPEISRSLTRLLISSEDLNEFLLDLEERSRPSVFLLGPDTVFLRDVDRCFRIEGLPGIIESETSGVHAALLHVVFPKLEDLYLDDNASIRADLECRRTMCNTFTVWRSAFLRREYENWWHGADGKAFRAAREIDTVKAYRAWNVCWDTIGGKDPGHYPGQNLYANTRRLGYVTV
ncbi:hypothetical protein DFH06DRAFT_1331390 [Mycena polygramma]|nr:hypothetical protein DFH06DRAFT_1331390 [Mycena polygramma]